MAVSSCGTLQAGKSETKDPEIEVVTRTEYLAGRTIIQEYPAPDSAFVADPAPLSTALIQEDDITADQAMGTAVEWSKTYHGLKDQYNTLRGWIAGVSAGQRATQAAIDAREEPKDTTTPEETE